MAMARCRPVAALLVPLALAAMSAMALPARAADGHVLVTYDQAARVGLERAWFAQAPVDPGRSRISTWFHYFDAIYCVSDSGIITAINSETGAEIWSRRVGKLGGAAFGPDANQKYLGVISGTTMYMLDRATGRLKWSRDVGGAPSSGPALSQEYAFVALTSGRIEGYKLDDPKKLPWYYQSKGHTYLRPTTTGRIVSWPTSEGYLYVSLANNPKILFRLATKDDIVTSPAEMDPFLYIASKDGYLYCLHELNGREQWRFGTGFPITSSPAIVGDHAYVASMEPAIHCVNAKTGARVWDVAGVSHFAAQGKDRVYASDHYGNLIIIDSKTGSVLGNLHTGEGISTLVNDESDRIYLVNDRGLVQCLREIGATEPTLYRKPVEEASTVLAGAKPGQPSNPFETEAAPAEASPAVTAPAGTAPADGDNPFGGAPPAPGGQPAGPAPAGNPTVPAPGDDPFETGT